MSFANRYLDHFANPRGIGEIEKPDSKSQVQHEGGGCFDRVKLTLRITDGRIAEARFRARACSGTIAALSALTEMVAGKTLKEAGAITPDDLVEYLEGIPEAKRHSVELAARALQECLDSNSDE